jgi:hypothetical protein
MQMSRMAAAALVALGVAAPAAAQTADEIVARHLAARGGEAKLKAIQTIKVTRTVGTPFTRVNVVIYRKRPNLLRVEQAPAGQPTLARGINADAAWDTGAGGKVTLRPPLIAAEARDLEADFDGDLLVDWKAKGHTVELEGKEALSGSDAFKLKVTTKSGAVRTIHLDAATYLDRQHSGVNTLPNGRKSQFVMTFGNWQDVQGVKFAFDLDEERNDGQITQSFATYTQKIELNAPMEDTLFATPAGATAPAGK